MTTEIKDAVKEALIAIAGKRNVFTEPTVLEKYSRDQSFTPARKPQWVVKPQNKEQIQAILKFAQETSQPVVPFSSGTDFHGGAVPSQGGILVDMSQVKGIRELDTHLWSVSIDPGLTFAELKEALAKDNLRAFVPLMMPPSASVLGSYVERDVVPQAADFVYGVDQMQTVCVFFGNGESFTMGNPAIQGAPHCTPFGPGLDYWRMYNACQGTMGIVWEINLRLVPYPRAQQVFFSPFPNFPDAHKAILRIQQQELGLECFAINNWDLATMLVEEAAQDTKALKAGTYVGPTGAKPWAAAQRQRFEALRQALPPWTVITDIVAWARYPEEKVAYQTKDLKDLAAKTGFLVKPYTGSVTNADKIVADELILPWRMQKRFGYKGSCQGLWFYATGNNIPKIEEVLNQTAAKYNYPTAEIGKYIQPVERARTYFCAFDLYCNLEDAAEVERVKALYLEASDKMIDAGAFFDRPYGPWAEMMYRRDLNYAEYLKKYRAINDPNGIMNPGKLCF